MAELKPCPFCGGGARVFTDGFDRYAVMCYKCGVVKGIELECGAELNYGWRAMYRPLDEAIEAWNRRTENDRITRRIL